MYLDIGADEPASMARVLIEASDAERTGEEGSQGQRMHSGPKRAGFEIPDDVSGSFGS